MQRQLQSIQYQLRQRSFAFQGVRRTKALSFLYPLKYQLQSHLKILSLLLKHPSRSPHQRLRAVSLLPTLHHRLPHLIFLIRGLIAILPHLHNRLQLMYGTISMVETPTTLGHLGAPRLSKLTQRLLSAEADPRRKDLPSRMQKMIPCQRLRCLPQVGRHPRLLEEQA